MVATDLPSKPLVEALVEFKWVPSNAGLRPNIGLGTWTDPSYPLYLGILYEAIKDRFPITEELPAKQLPDLLTPGLVKTRFRASTAGWPLVQAGPGVLTINFTASYTWPKFRDTAAAVYANFLSAYAASGVADHPSLTASTLRYIDAIHTDEPNTLHFVHDKLHLGLNLPDSISGSSQVAGPLATMDLRLSLPLKVPVGSGNLRVATGTHEQHRAIICEFSVVSKDDATPQTHDEVVAWLDDSHTLIESWFFAMIEGELYEEFRRPR